MLLFGIYLVKVSVCLAVFYILYATFFRHYTFFAFNRSYLLFGIIASFMIPALHFSLFENHYPLTFADAVPKSLFEPDHITSSEISSPEASAIDLVSIFSVAYFLGVIFLLLRALLLIVRIFRIKKNSETRLEGNFKITRTTSGQPFSFFGSIFLPQREISSFIIDHEKAHISQYHWIDLVVVEILCILLWFNPICLLYRRSLKLQHEYLADAQTIKNGASLDHYMNCLLEQVYFENSVPSISPFYSSSIKKRIIMITKNKTSKLILGLYLFAIPVTCILLFAFSNNPGADLATSVVYVNQNDEQPSIFPVEINKATIGAGYGERMHPVLKVKKLHTGIDLTLPEGEIVMTTADGIVREAKTDSVRGNYLIIKHNDIYTTSYFHLKSFQVSAGEKVKKGQTIGYVGSTGLSKVPHLHYEVSKNGKAVDPQSYLPGK